MKLITITQYQVHMTLMTLRRSLGQRSVSASDGHRNLVNPITPESLNGFESKLTQTLAICGALNIGFKVMNSIGQDHIKYFPTREFRGVCLRYCSVNTFVHESVYTHG